MLYTHQQNGAAERSMKTILESTRTTMAESGLPLKYWANTIQTVIYTKNLMPNNQQPKTIPAELWSGLHQDISHFQPFSCTTYAHVPLDLNLPKLNPRSVKTVLLGYFGHNSYKLLDKSTGKVFKSQDIIFEERVTYLARQPLPTVITNDNDMFIYKPQTNSNTTNADKTKKLNLLPLCNTENCSKTLR